MPVNIRCFLLFILIITLSFINQVSAQNNIIKVDLLGLVQGAERFTYERFITPKLSALINFENGIYDVKKTRMLGNDLGEIYNIKGYGFMPELRFYPVSKGNIYKGIFIGAHYRYRWISENFYTNIDLLSIDPNSIPLSTTKGIIQDYGANIGYKVKWHYFVFEALTGIGNVIGSYEIPNSRGRIYDRIKKSNLDENKFGLRTQLSIGFSFPNFNKPDYQDKSIKNTRTL